MSSFRIDGSLVNLCSKHGLGAKQSARLIAAIIDYAQSDGAGSDGRSTQFKGTNLCGEISAEIITKDHHLYHNARSRILGIEKAIQHLNENPEAKITAQNWTKDRDNYLNTRMILDTFEHVISRPAPQTEEDMILDATRLLIKSGQYFDGKSPSSRPLTYQSKPGISINIEENEVMVVTTINKNIQFKNFIAGKSRVHFQEDIPEIMQHVISKRCMDKASAYQTIEWDGFTGPYESRLHASQLQGFRSGQTYLAKRLELTINTGLIEVDISTGEITEYLPTDFSL